MRKELIIRSVNLLNKVILLATYLRPDNNVLDNIVRGYGYLWKGKWEIIKKHIFIDSLNDAGFSYSFALWLGWGEKNVKIEHSCSSPICKENLDKNGLSGSLCQLSSPLSKNSKKSKLKRKVESSVFDDQIKKIIHIASEFSHEFYHHAQIKTISILSYPIVYAIKEELKDVYFKNIKSKDIDLTIGKIYDFCKMVATYVAINPYEGIFLVDTVSTTEDKITKYVTESEVFTRQTDREYSKFMNEFNEDWMEGVVDSYIHLGDYIKTIVNNMHLPTVSYKIIGWSVLMLGLKYNTDQKQEMLEDLYNPNSVNDLGEQNYSSLDNYSNYLGEEFCRSDIVW